ncbi:DUF3782 domain-containing protein [Desulfobacterales bacterium HSG17]|nr:DUF3782 domain-containing protein [Desulfobacterales bacterium HSG17]
MQTELTQNQIKNMILSELPGIIKDDYEFRRCVLDITREQYADKEKTGDRIDRILDELKRDREKRDKKWEAQEKKWEAQEKKWESQEKKWESQEKKWDKQDKKLEAWEEKWELERKEDADRWKAWEEKWERERKEQAAKWEASDRRWEENQKNINEMLKSIKDLETKHDSTLGALGARWGLHSESAFRNGMKSILEDFPDVTVERYLDFDHEGRVFGHPDQIELDLVIHNGIIILCELKSSMSKPQVYSFWRKKEFYENKHNCKVKRTMIISPMVDPEAAKTAEKLGVEVYSYSDKVKF